MRVDVVKLRNAVENVNTITSDTTGKHYIMLEFTNEKLNVCYSNGKISFIEKIDCESNSNETFDKVVVELENFLTKLSVYGASSGIEVEPLEISIASDELITMSCRKYYNQIQYDSEGEMIDNGEGEALVSRVEAGHYKTDMKYEKITDSVKFSMTTRMNYDEIFESDNWVTCGVVEFRTLLGRLLNTDGARNSYISPKKGAGFSVGTAYTSFIPMEFSAVAASLHNSTVKKLVSILQKIKTETVDIVAINSQFVKVVSEDSNIGLVCEQCAVEKQQLATLATFESLDYESQGLVFNRAVLSDMVNGSLIVGGRDVESDMKFMVSGDTVTGSTLKKSSGTSMDNLDIFTNNVIGDISQFNDYSIHLSFAILERILKDCTGNVIKLGFSNMGDSKYLKVTDIMRTSGKDLSEVGCYYLCI